MYKKVKTDVQVQDKWKPYVVEEETSLKEINMGPPSKVSKKQLGDPHPHKY